MSIHPAQM